MTFNALKQALKDFGLLEYVEELYSPEGKIEDFELLEDRIIKLSTSQRLLIKALTDVYHGRETVFFIELVDVLDRDNREKLIKWWSNNFKEEMTK